MIDSGVSASWEPGEIIYEAGSHPQEAYLILEGFVNIETKDGLKLNKLGGESAWFHQTGSSGMPAVFWPACWHCARNTMAISNAVQIGNALFKGNEISDTRTHPDVHPQRTPIA